MGLVESLKFLAEENMSGLAFLTAYGVTWLACGVLWHRAPERLAAFVTLFQGLVAFPVALGLSSMTGAIGGNRPVSDEITQLSVLIGTSQLLGLPFVIYLVVKQQYTLAPFALAAMTSMHFVLYTWLYQTPVYIVLAVLISIGTMTVMFSAPETRRRAGPVRVCFLTGSLLLTTALLFLSIHLGNG